MVDGFQPFLLPGNWSNWSNPSNRRTRFPGVGYINVWLRAISWNVALVKSNSDTTNRRWGMMRCWAVGPWRIRLTLPGSLLFHKIWTFDHIDICLVCPSIPGPRLIFFTHGVPRRSYASDRWIPDDLNKSLIELGNGRPWVPRVWTAPEKKKTQMS